MNRNCIAIVIVLINCLTMRAQHVASSKILGTIKNESGEAIDFANVTLHLAKDSSLIKTILSDEQGYFSFDEIPHGQYFLLASYLGHSTGRIDFVLDDNSSGNYHTMVLQKLSTQLDEVTVSSMKPLVERKLDRLVVNVDNSILATGLTALDVLQKSPGVTVQQESSINLKGKSGVIVMIDGKPSPLSGADLMAYLKSIPSSLIKQIDLVSNPSSKYDAAGNAGIIDIRFKKDQKMGLNGGVNFSIGQGVYPKPSASTNFNFREHKYNVFGSYAHSLPIYLTRFFINRKFFDSNGRIASTFVQNSFIKQPISSDKGRIGLDYFIGKKTVVGFLMAGNLSDHKRNGRTLSDISNADNQKLYSTQNNILMTENRFNGTANINLKHTLDDNGKELTLDLDYGHYDAATYQDISNRYFAPDGLQTGFSNLYTAQNGNIEVKSAKADFIMPFSKGFKTEFGGKSSIVSTDNAVNFYNVIDQELLPDSVNTNHFIYKENVNACYALASKEFSKYDVQLGLRLEHTNTTGRQIVNASTFKRNYVNLFPNALLNYKHSDKNQYSISYSKRIERPSYRQLNPFKIFVDAYTYIVGDPKLKPVITHSFEFNHTLMGKYVTTLSYASSKETITDVFTQDDVSKISYQSPANIQNFKQWSIASYLPFNLGNKISTTFSGSIYWGQYSGPLQGGTLTNASLSWDARLANSFVLGKGWTAELEGFYQSRNAWGLFIIKDLGQISMGIQKHSSDKNTTLKIAISDLFLMNHIAVEVDYQNQDFFTERTWDARVATFSLSQRFGKNTVTKARQRSSGIEDEKRRAG